MQSRKKAFLRLYLIITIAFVCACAAHRTEQQGMRRYDLRGRVEALDFDRKRVTVSHDDIKDYMDAMTMSFAVKDEGVLKGLKSGDMIDATLVVDPSVNLTWLENIRIEENAKHAK